MESGTTEKKGALLTKLKNQRQLKGAGYEGSEKYVIDGSEGSNHSGINANEDGYNKVLNKHHARRILESRENSSVSLESDLSSSLKSEENDDVVLQFHDKKKRKVLKSLFSIDLKCTICFHIFVKPVTLVCGHT